MRLQDRFEGRMLKILGELMTADELEETDWAVTEVLYPAPSPIPGQPPHPALGYNIALARRTILLTDHVILMDLCQDPYLPDADLKLKVKNILDQLVQTIIQINAEKSNGQAPQVPGGLIIPGRN